MRAPRAFRDAARTSCLVRRRRYSHVGGGRPRRVLANLGSAAASGPRAAAACPHRGPTVARPLDREAAAIDLGTAAATLDRGTVTPRVCFREPRPPQPPAGGPPPRALSGNRHRRTRMGGRRR
jgi:hypothetical protein